MQVFEDAKILMFFFLEGVVIFNHLSFFRYYLADTSIFYLQN